MISPSHVAVTVVTVGVQATVTDRLVYCTFNLVGLACAYVLHKMLPPLAQLASAPRCRWYCAKLCR